MSEPTIETTVAQHSTEIGQLGVTLREVWGEIKENRRHSDQNFERLAASLSNIGRANWPVTIGVLLGVLGFATSLIVGGYFVIQLSIANAVTPVKSTATTAAETATTLATSHVALTAEVYKLTAMLSAERASSEKSLAEIETQFHASDEVRNIETAVSHRTFAMLWQKLFPEIPYPPIVYYPHIAK